MKTATQTPSDAEITRALRAGHTTAGAIKAHLFGAGDKDSTTSEGLAQVRAVDRALQRMRKAGQLRFDRKNGWSKARPRKAGGAS